jgi:hypothetical protein
MSNMALKIIPSPDTDRPVSAQELHRAAQRRTALLLQYDHQLINVQIKQERNAGSSGHRLSTERDLLERERDITARAEQLLHCDLPAEPPHGLTAVLAERKAIEQAIVRLQSEERRALAAAAVEWLADHGEQRWNENRRRLAQAVFSVLEIVREGKAIAAEAAAATGAPLSLLGSDHRDIVTPHAREVLERCRDAGVIGAFRWDF